MKQKLLFSLMALLVSVGMVKAQTVTVDVPASSSTGTISITGVVGKMTVGGVVQNSTSFTVPAAGGSFSIGVSDAPSGETAKFTGITISGRATSITVNNADLETLNVSNNSKTLTTLTLTSANIRTLSANDANLAAFPSISGFATDGSISISLTNNEISTMPGNLQSYFASASSVNINLNGNKIKPGILYTAPVNVAYGTQKAVVTKTTQANVWFDAYSEIVTDLYNTGSAPDRDKVSYAWKNITTNVSGAATQSDTYRGSFMFYYSSYFTDGNYEVTITPGNTNLPTYVVTGINVTAAKFKFSYEKTEGGSFGITYVKTGAPVATSPVSGMERGTQLLFTALPDPGYSFAGFDLDGIQAVTGETNVYQVIGSGMKETVSVLAKFSTQGYKVAHSVAQGQGLGTYTATVDGNTLSSGSTIATGKEVIIRTSPNPSYKARVLVNLVEKDPETGTDNTFKIPVADKDLTISVIFESAATMPKLRIAEATTGTLTSLNINGTTLNVGAQHSIAVGAYVAVTNIVPNGALVTGVLLNTQALELDSNGNTWFNMPAEGATLTVVTKSVSDIKVTSGTDKVATSEVLAQEHEYDGTAKKFLYNTNPAVTDNFTVKYSPSQLSNYLTDVPTAMGTYKVEVTRPADNTYSAVNYSENNSNSNFWMKIVQGKPKITSLPSVTVNNVTGTYQVSGGSAQINGRSLPGRFIVTQSLTIANPPITATVGPDQKCVLTVSHNVNVEFIATSGSSDDPNYKNSDPVVVPVTIGASAGSKRVKFSNIPSDMTFTMKNGEVAITNNASVPVGTTLTLTADFPVGYTGVYVAENKGNFVAIGTNITPSTLGATSFSTNVTVMEDMDFTVRFTNPANPAVEIRIDIKTPKGPVEYTGTKLGDAILYEKLSDFNVTAVNGNLKTNDGDDIFAKMILIYKDASGNVVPTPINVGKYTVSIEVPEFGTNQSTRIKKYSRDFVGAFEITKKKVTIGNNDWPKTALVPPGKKLGDAIFVTGVSPIAGSFAFVDPNITPEDGGEYTIKFVPNDTNNYAEVSIGKTAKVESSDRRVVVIETPVNGTIVVKDALGRFYTSGMEIPSTVTSLTITANPETGYSLTSLTVNGANFTSGNSYTVGSSSVSIKATFSSATSFAVKVNGTRGVRITSGESGTVAAGGNYTFTLAYASGDTPYVEDEDGNRIDGDSNGRYVVQNVMKTKTINVSLSSPTQFTITVKQGTHGEGTIKVENLTAPTSSYYYYGDNLRFTATQGANYVFMSWWDGTSANPKTYTVTSNQTISATFSPVGIEPVENLTVYGGEGYISVAAPGEVKVTVVSMTGQSKQVRVNGEQRIEVPAGIYGIVVEQGDKASRMKVVVR